MFQGPNLLEIIQQQAQEVTISEEKQGQEVTTSEENSTDSQCSRPQQAAAVEARKRLTTYATFNTDL